VKKSVVLRVSGRQPHDNDNSRPRSNSYEVASTNLAAATCLPALQKYQNFKQPVTTRLTTVLYLVPGISNRPMYDSYSTSTGTWTGRYYMLVHSRDSSTISRTRGTLYSCGRLSLESDPADDLRTN
jgi:hypothetical protein